MRQSLPLGGKSQASDPGNSQDSFKGHPMLETQIRERSWEWLCVCTLAWTRVHVCTRAVHACVHIRKYMCGFVSVCMQKMLMYRCVHIYVHACACVYACVFVCICVYRYGGVYMYLHVCVYVCTRACMHVCICVCMCVYVYAHMCMCAYMCACMYTCAHVCI